MKKILILILTLVSMNGSRAESGGHRYPDKNIMMATCIMGRGCSFQLSAVSRADLDLVHGTAEEGYYSNLPENAIMVSARTKSGNKDYVETRYSRSQLDRLYGGDGHTMIHLFDPHIQPLDGEWIAEIGRVTSGDCFVDLAPYVSQFSGTKDGGRVSFPKPFQARFLMDNPEIKWVKLSANTYRGSTNFGQSSGAMTLTYDVEIVNERFIQGLALGTIRVPTLAPCQVRIPVTFRLLKRDQDPEEDNDEDDEEDEWENPDDWDELRPVVPKGDRGGEPIDRPDNRVPRLGDDEADDLLPVNPKPKGDDLLDPYPAKKSDPPAKPGTDVPRLPDDPDELLPVKPKPKGDELLDIKPRNTGKPNDNGTKR